LSSIRSYNINQNVKEKFFSNENKKRDE